jgi:hypothetical protein
MENDNLNILSTIKKVEISENVHEKLLFKIIQAKNKTIPLYKVSISAAIFLVLILGEIFFVSKSLKSNEKTNTINHLLLINNNTLYYE